MQPYIGKSSASASYVFAMSFSRLYVGFDALLRFSEMGVVSKKSAAQFL
jgi:hypothetical protein